MSDAELAFYDALEVNDAAMKIMGDAVLQQIAQELTASAKSGAATGVVAPNAVRL
jgi:type I restriction enzyme R subunit